MSDPQPAPQGGPDTGGAPTLVQRATTALRDDILRGELKPGSRVHLSQTAARLNMSVVPVREALGTLVAEGLVVSLYQRGFRVAGLSLDEVTDLYDLRMVLDPLAVRWAVPRLTDEDRDEIRRRFDELDESGLPDVVADLRSDPHRRFHFAIYDRCGSAWLLRFLNTAWDFSQRYQLASGEQLDHEDQKVIGELHVQILDACLAGDADAAAEFMVEHLRGTIRRFQQYALDHVPLNPPEPL